MLKVKILNMTGHAGGAVRHQFIIKTNKGVYFQSYDSIVIFQSYKTGKTILDRQKWDCSTTTGKYRNLFLGEKKAETERKIKSGEYTLADLN